MHDTATAIQYCDRLMELHAGEECSANIAIARGQPEKAIDMYRSAVSGERQRAPTGATGGNPAPLWETRWLVGVSPRLDAWPKGEPSRYRPSSEQTRAVRMFERTSSR